MNFLQRFAARFFFGSSSVFENANRSPRRANVPGAAPQDAVLDLTPGVRSELVRRSRYLTRNSGFIRELVGSMALYSVGDGLKPQAESEDAEWNRQAEAYFNRWGRHAELSGRFNLTQCQHLVCRAVDVDGEIFIHKVEQDGQLKVQLIETHRIGSDSDAEGMVDGVRLNADGRPISYRLVKDDGQGTDLPAAHVLHVYDPDAVSQVRGFPSLQHSINHILDEMELLALEKHAVKDNSDITRVLTTGRVDADDGDFHLATPAQGASDSGQLQTVLGGKLVMLQPGEEIKPFESNRPSPTFTGFLDHLRRDSALGMLPFEFASDSSKLAGSGVRLTVARADRRFSYRQTLLIDRMLRPLWLWVIGNAIAEGKLPAVAGWTEVNFTTPRRVTVDAGREAAQNREDVKAGLKTLSDHFAELGMDINEELENRAREMKLIQSVAAKYGLAPQDLYASFHTPAGTGTDQQQTQPDHDGKHDEPAQ